MNKTLERFARQQIKEGLAKLSEEEHRVFKLMYARDHGRRSVEDAVAMPINDVVDQMPVDQLDWALTQTENSLDNT